MSATDGGDLGDFSLADLFRMEVETQTVVMTEHLLALEREPEVARHYEELMRSAHSLKGAAGIVDNRAAARIAHSMEDCFVAAQHGHITLPQERIDLLLDGVDLLSRLSKVAEEDLERWQTTHHREIEAFLDSLASSIAEPAGTVVPATQAPASTSVVLSPPVEPTATEPEPAEPADVAEARSAVQGNAMPGATRGADAAARSLRVTADNLNRLLAFAGESVVASRWVNTFASDLLRMKQLQNSISQSITNLRETLAGAGMDERVQAQCMELQRRTGDYLDLMTGQITDLDLFDRRFYNLSKRLYQEVLDCRMRPFSDGVQGFPRLVRDAARSLGKEVRLDIVGGSTPVDREVLERVEAPLGHLLRNAVDHAIELPADRLQAGKPALSTIRLEARHSAGMLMIEVTDDGRGIDLEMIRSAVVRKNLTTAALAAEMTDAELLEFLFLPGFSMKDTVTQLSGRGVGLDVVQTMAKEVGGGARISSNLGRGTQFQLQLPLTLSVLRTLIVEVGGETYAFPLARIAGALKVPRDQIESVEGREHFRFGDQQVGLVTAHQVLGVPDAPAAEAEVPVLVLGDKNSRYGVVMDRFLNERELVVLPLDPRLGKIKDISAAALMPDQSPVLIVDVDDMVRSIELLVSGGRLAHVSRGDAAQGRKSRKRVLVVDDSLTVRELVRKLISSKGYVVEVAVDGMDGWNAVRTGNYDLVVTDVDMPRMDGIELVNHIKKDTRLHSLPVMIVSYKDREEDRQRGLEAGADYYLTKGSFHDETLLRALQDLIGEAGA
ncbi:hybrid sensor histidine kinase/response regulator [Verrucomicrobium sp. BvORR106]|uniref:hybrid sensor histidine kinase/response regulator n=1 Tax=Verrucomicrobium sp. BvORR106 TaxID=1403819 RepID=UPI0005710F1D|nr:hybrid sensor histidine kinase/response regulator [Verrucomicrobium sp. BvORR106]